MVLVAAVAFLLFSEEEWILRASFALLSTASCIFSLTVVGYTLIGGLGSSPATIALRNERPSYDFKISGETTP